MKRLLLFFVSVLLCAQESAQVAYIEVPISTADQAALKAASDKVKQAQDALAALEERVKETAMKGSTKPPPSLPTLRAAKAAGKCAVIHSGASLHGDRVLITTTTHNLCQ